MLDAGSRAHPRPGLRNARLLVLLAALTMLLGLGVGVGLHALLSSSASRPTVVTSRHGLDGQASWAAGARPAPQINGLLDQNGQPFSLRSLRGHTVAIVFFDSHCHQECPLEGHALSAAERTLPARDRPVLVAVSVNPQDTRASVRAAIRSWGLSSVARWYWLMGHRPQLAPAWRSYRIFVAPHPVNGDISHTEAVYLVDRRGFERSAYLWPFAFRFVAHDMRVLARERGA
jgi:cytochrome oxidase Cu insertion factor (SCO1/SenC/PrrC family)